MKKFFLFTLFTSIFSCHEPYQISQKFSSLANFDLTKVNISLPQACSELSILHFLSKDHDKINEIAKSIRHIKPIPNTDRLEIERLIRSITEISYDPNNNISEVFEKCLDLRIKNFNKRGFCKHSDSIIKSFGNSLFRSPAEPGFTISNTFDRLKNISSSGENKNIIDEHITVLCLVKDLFFYGKDQKPTFLEKKISHLEERNSQYLNQNGKIYIGFQRARYQKLFNETSHDIEALRKIRGDLLEEEKALFEKIKTNALRPFEEILEILRLNEIYEQNPGLQRQLERIYEEDPDFNPNNFFRANPDLNQMRLVR